MKNLLILAISFFLTSSLMAENAASMGGSCVWNSWFKYPASHQNLDEGEDVYVKVDPQKYHDIKYMDLYINGSFVRRENNYPFEWGRPHGGGDHKLRHLKPGHYKLTCKIVTRCGYYKTIYTNFKVDGHGGQNNCHFGNPLHDLHWLKQLNHHNPNYKICQYKKNGKVFFKLIPCHGGSPKWYDCYGKQYSHVNGCHLVKCWYDPCGHNGGGHCEWKSWFEKCKPYFKGHKYDLYVRVGTKKYKDIAFMELYVNGQFVRKETNAPYEWGRPHSGGDYKLRNLHLGKQYVIKCRIKDRCGKWHEIKKTVFFNNNYGS